VPTWERGVLGMGWGKSRKSGGVTAETYAGGLTRHRRQSREETRFTGPNVIGGIEGEQEMGGVGSQSSGKPLVQAWGGSPGR